MLRTLFVGSALFLFVTGIAIGGNAHKGPKVITPLKGVTGEEPSQRPVIIGSYASTYSRGPGDSIGFSIYDYGTNRSPCHNLINYGDGTFALGRMAAEVDETVDRGTYYSYSSDGGVTWTPLAWVEQTRQGWGNIDQFVDAGGVEVTAAHTGLVIGVDAAKGAGAWSISNTASVDATWARLAVGGGFSIHIIAGIRGNPPADLGYTRSLDAGTTFDILDQSIFTSPGYTPTFDGYDIAATGITISIVSAGQGGDAVLATSTDDGTTWTEQVIHDVAGTGELPMGQQEFQPDGAVACVYDNAGNLHVAWTNFLAIGDASNNPELFYSIDAPISYWSAATGVVEIAPSVSDTTIQKPTNHFGNVTTQPDIGVDANDNPYIVFSQHISEQDDSLLYYQHVYGVGSPDGGTTWGPPVDITPGTGFDAAFHSLADLVDDYVHITYFSDPLAGNNLRGNHPLIPVAVMYHKFLAADLLVGVKELPGQVPSDYRLVQNYPNPFNPSTIIRYSVPTTSFVSLKVYDVLGREVATLVNEEQGPGTYSADFDAVDLSNGTYFYRIQAGEFSDVKKMMLLK